MVIDSHVHLGQREHWNTEVVRTWFEPFGLSPDLVHIDTDKVVADMTAAGVDFSFVLALNCKRFLDIWVPNEYVAEACEKYPDRFLGFASVDPVDRSAVSELRYAIETLGLKGLKLAPTYQDFHPSDPRAYAVYALCAELGVPILIHQGWTSNRWARMAYQPVMLLDDICIQFPDLYLIVAHMGMPAQRDTLHLIAKHSNVYADLAARDLPTYGGGPRTMFADVSDAIDQDVVEKIFWGTDFPWSTPAESLAGLRDMNRFADSHRPAVPADVVDGLLSGHVLGLAGRLGWEIPGQ
jgi:predicted TIM-barrel fold metal-dependent hydrolase